MLVLSRQVGEMVISDVGLLRVAKVAPESVELELLADTRHRLELHGDSSIAIEGEVERWCRYRIRLMENGPLSIDDDNSVHFVAMGPRGQARLGLEAPKDAHLHRLEVYEAIRRPERKGYPPSDSEIEQLYANRGLLDGRPPGAEAG